MSAGLLGSVVFIQFGRVLGGIGFIRSHCMLSQPFSLFQYLESVKPLHDAAGFQRMKRLTAEFEKSLGNRLQRYLKLKALWATNYVCAEICSYFSGHNYR